MNSRDKDNENQKCPICGEDELEDISPRKSNNVLGSGFSSWKIIDIRCCPKCRIIIHPKTN